MQDPVQTSKSEVAPIERQILAETLSEEMEILAARGRRVARLRLLWNERRFVLRWVLVGLLAATLIAFVIPKQYESTAQLMPPDSQSTSNLALLGGLSGSSGGGLALLAGDLLGLKSNGALFTGVLRSRTVEDRIIDRFGLKKVYGKRLQIEAREKLADRTAITEDRKSGIITITVTDHDPKRATAIASAYVDELNVLIAQLSTSSARRERIFLEDRLSSVKQDLEAAENDFSRFASTKGTVDISEQGKAIVEAAATLEGELIAAQSQLEGLKQIYSDQNVRVRSAQARIDSLRHQMRKLSGNADNSIDGIEKVSDPYPTLRQLPILGVPYADKMRRLKVEEVVFETLTKQYELAKVEEAKEIPSVKELDTPVVPEHKSFPPRLFIMLSGTLCGAMLGMFWVLAQARWQEIDPQDPGKALAREVFEKLAARIPNAAEEKLQGNARHVEGGQAGSSKGATAGQSD